jgi:hypothetical protein
MNPIPDNSTQPASLPSPPFAEARARLSRDELAAVDRTLAYWAQRRASTPADAGPVSSSRNEPSPP